MDTQKKLPETVATDASRMTFLPIKLRLSLKMNKYIKMLFKRFSVVDFGLNLILVLAHISIPGSYLLALTIQLLTTHFF